MEQNPIQQGISELASAIQNKWKEGIPADREAAIKRIAELEQQFQDIPEELEDREYYKAREPIDIELSKIYTEYPDLKDY